MEELIRHEGIVTRVDGEKVRVAIVQTSACAACKAQSMCMASESQEKMIDAVAAEPMEVGEYVEVEVRERLAWKAVLLAYVAPFLVMIAVLAVLDVTTVLSEAVTGTISLGAIALYYLVLHMFRGRLEKQFSFVARKINKEPLR